jgi:hypothetical protein
MDEKKEKQKISTCMENIPFAEMMQRMAGQKGIGSLCADMMKQVMEKQGDSRGVHCAEMMQAMMKRCCGTKQDALKTKEEASHVGDK